MQRTRFCLTGGFRDMYVQKNNKMFYALLIAITIQSIGLLILTATDILQIPAHSFPILGTIIGSFYFWNWNSIGWRMCNRYLVSRW